MAPPAPVAAVSSDQLFVDNDQIRDNLFDFDDKRARAKRNSSGNTIFLNDIYQDNK